MHNLRLNLSSLLVAVSFAVAGAGFARADVIAGPSLSAPDVDWQFSGIGFTANVNSYLTGFTFQNQGLADSVVLVDTTGDVLDSVGIPSDTPSDIVSVNWQLTAGDQYYLLQSTSSNSLFTSYSGVSPSDGQITLTDTGIFSGSADSSRFGIRGNQEWAAFNDVTTVPAGASPVPEPDLGFALGSGLVVLGVWRKRCRMGSTL
jgi:hypothetical protein